MKSKQNCNMAYEKILMALIMAYEKKKLEHQLKEKSKHSMCVSMAMKRREVLLMKMKK